jgi:hypothetical protein
VNERLLASWKTAANICIERQQCDQEHILRQQDARRTRKQAAIRGAKLVEAQEHAAESYRASSKREARRARKQRVNNVKRDDHMELDTPVASASKARLEPAITLSAPTPAPVVTVQTAQFAQPVQPTIIPVSNTHDATATATQAFANITLTQLNTDPAAYPAVSGSNSIDDFIDYEGSGSINVAEVQGIEMGEAA